MQDAMAVPLSRDPPCSEWHGHCLRPFVNKQFQLMGVSPVPEEDARSWPAPIRVVFLHRDSRRWPGLSFTVTTELKRFDVEWEVVD